ncbi:MAG TPA: polysaccharide biosynthesis C-terminal domain-containing protein [Candidatus Limnocylindrales bacterium]
MTDASLPVAAETESDPALNPVATPPAPQGRPFARRVVSVFSAKIVTFGIAFVTTLVVSRLLGPDGKGAFVGVTALPALVGTIGVFGLPNAINYFTAKNVSVRGLMLTSLMFVAVISVFVVALLWVTLPFLEKSIFSVPIERLGPGTGDQMLRLILITIPAGMLATFVGTILYGRHEVKFYTAIMIGQAAVTLIALVLAVGVFRLGVEGAVGASVVVSCLGAAAVIVAVQRVAARTPGGDPVNLRSILGYGARVYPASITGYFNYRADVFIIQWLMVASAAPAALGLYSMAVTMAEFVFYIPDAVTTIFMPTIAGSTADSADAKLGRVSRMTFLVTVVGALALIPVAWLGIHLVLPKFNDCLPAFMVLLPAVVSLSLGKVMTSYISGRGRPGPISVGAAVTLALNLAANVILIPRFGIVGAAAASLISYTAMSLMMVLVACRVSGLSLADLVVPRKGELLTLVSVARAVIAKLRGKVSA